MRLRAKGLTWQEFDGELVVLDLEASTYLTTNGSGALLMKLLAQDRTRAELVNAVVEQYDVTPEQAGSDVDAFIAALSTKGLLEVDGS
jgi:Coenzyme PQQ synthesis protein D (PqqD)